MLAAAARPHTPVHAADSKRHLDISADATADGTHSPLSKDEESPTFTPTSQPRADDLDGEAGEMPTPTRLFAPGAEEHRARRAGGSRGRVQHAIILVEGNISAGKSTLCQKVGYMMGVKVEQEPTETNPYLVLYYKDPKRWAYPMQIWLLRQRYYVYLRAIQHAATSGESVLLDRSVYSDWVFAIKNNEDGNISNEDFGRYMELRHKLMEALPAPSALVYLRVAPSVCYDRVHKLRCRGCESTIPLEYLEGLNRHYETLVTELQSRTAVVDVAWDEFGEYADVAAQVEDAVHDAAAGAGADGEGGLAAFAAKACAAARNSSLVREFEAAVVGGLMPDPSMIEE